MDREHRRRFVRCAGAWLLSAAAGLAGCGTTHPLPPYETPLAHVGVQSVRTTAYTHTESDHLAYGDHNALGGTLRAAATGNGTVSSPDPAAVPSTPILQPDGRMTSPGEGGYQGPGVGPVASDPPTPEVPAPEAARTLGDGRGPIPAAGVGSAAADWSRWPAGTVFRIAATGQVYKVDDYGWALAGRNTIDLYQPTRAAMNAWGTRRVEIEILRWGDPAESLRMLRRHQGYRHIHRMVLELEGKPRAAAALD